MNEAESARVHEENVSNRSDCYKKGRPSFWITSARYVALTMDQFEVKMDDA